MRKRVVLGLSLVLSISLISIIAFVFSFTGNSENDKEVATQNVISLVSKVVPTSTPISTESAPTKKPNVNKPKICGVELKDGDAYLLAKIAMAEAETEDTKGKALVMLVVLNRVMDDEFPDSIEGVIFQKGQFSPISNGRYNEVEPDEDCYKALNLIQVKGWNKSRRATYFESKSASTWHSENLKFLFKHGNHYFYKE